MKTRNILGLFILSTAMSLSANTGLEGGSNPEDILFENTGPEPELLVEDWMTIPFNSLNPEADMTETMVENLEMAPFDASFEEEDLMVEAWMTESFLNSEEDVQQAVENPLMESIESTDNNFAEPELIVEDWMTAPF